MTIPDFSAGKQDEGGWSFPTFLYLTKALRDSDADLRAATWMLYEERDRRYAEVGAEREKAIILQLNAKEMALNLKSLELDRRLDALNGEAGRLATVLSRSVPREVWEESQKSLDVWKAGVDKTLNTMAGKSAQTIYIVGLLLAGLTIALKFFVK